MKATFHSTDVNETFEHVNEQKKVRDKKKEIRRKLGEERAERSVFANKKSHSKGYSKKYAESSIWDKMGPDAKKSKD